MYNQSLIVWLICVYLVLIELIYGTKTRYQKKALP